MNLRRILDDFVEAADGITPDWDDAVRRASTSPQPREYAARGPSQLWSRFRARRALLLVTAALAGVVVVSAVAAQGSGRFPYWTFAGASDPTYPTTQTSTTGVWGVEQRALPPHYDADGHPLEVPTIRGVTAGYSWTLQAYVSEDATAATSGQLCVGIGPRERKPANEGAFESCWNRDFVDGDSADGHWAAIAVAIPAKIGTGPKLLFGPAAREVERVDLESDDGSVVRARTFDGPSNARVPGRVWVAVLPLDRLVRTLVPRNRDGDALERWDLEVAQ